MLFPVFLLPQAQLDSSTVLSSSFRLLFLFCAGFQIRQGCAIRRSPPSSLRFVFFPFFLAGDSGHATPHKVCLICAFPPFFSGSFFFPPTYLSCGRQRPRRTSHLFFPKICSSEEALFSSISSCSAFPLYCLFPLRGFFVVDLYDLFSLLPTARSSV